MFWALRLELQLGGDAQAHPGHYTSRQQWVDRHPLNFSAGLTQSPALASLCPGDHLWFSLV